jgi:hypothetical protein
MLSWCIVLDQKIAELSRFKQLLRPEERAVFDDLLVQCKHYAVKGEVFTSPVTEMSLLFWMIFAHHKKLRELEKRLGGLQEQPAVLHKTLKDYTMRHM